MSITRNRIEFILRGGRVRRFHTVPTVAEHTVGHHSFGVAWMVALLTDFAAPAALVAAALTHDLAEGEVGDVPAPTKRAAPGVKEAFDELEHAALAKVGLVMPPLSEAEERLLKMADCMDGMLNCIYERRLGNRAIKQAYWRFRTYVQDMKPEGRAAEVERALVDMWMEADK